VTSRHGAERVRFITNRTGTGRRTQMREAAPFAVQA
jgi:hypothetical protein